MKELENTHKLSSFLLEKNENEIRKAIDASHRAIKNSLNLPEDIKVSGFKLSTVEPGSAIECQTIVIPNGDGTFRVECI